MTGVPVRKTKLDTDKGDHVKTEGGRLQAKERDLELNLLSASEANSADTPILDASLQNCEKIKFYGLRHPICGALLQQPQQRRE